MPPTAYSPGMRLKIRDEEFSLLHAEHLISGNYKLVCLGISETVAGREWEFLSDLEAPEILRPEDTRLVQDTSPGFQDSLLYLETHLRSRVPVGEGVVLGHKAAMDVMDFQCQPARRALAQARTRILIADTVGLGKTLEAGILVTELMARGRGKRLLVVTVKSMLTQFQKEFWNRFTIPLVKMDSQGLSRVRSRIPRNHNPFDYIDKSIISVDTLKNENEYRVYLEKAYWDIIVIDEAHHVSFKGTRTLAHRLADLLGGRSDSLILLSATPHNGKPESFASLMKMLDPTSVADVQRYSPDEIKGLFIRRFRKDVAHQMGLGLPERQVLTWDARASSAEEEAYTALNALRFTWLDRTQTASQLQGGHMLKSVSLKKALLSSPGACAAQIVNMLNNLPDRPEAAGDKAQLAALKAQVDAIGAAQFSKYQHLLTKLRHEWAWSGRDSSDRLVIFTERIETLKFLQEHLQRDLNLGDKAVKTLTGSMSDLEVQSIIEDFGKERSALRLLIATDVASEGLNLHFQSHRLVHFDIPWSLMVFQQRNGRIDRYGQTQQPLIAYLLTRYQADRLGADVRVLEILIEKERAAHKNIGDPATLMGQFDPEKEELYTADLLSNQGLAQSFDQAPVEESREDALDALLRAVQAADAEAASSYDPAQPRFELFKDFDFLQQGLNALYAPGTFALDLAVTPEQQALSFNLSEDLKAYLNQVLPRELRPDSDRLELIGDPRVMMAKIRLSQAQEEAWPEADYLWANHPVFDWLKDRLRARLGRLQAPVLTEASLGGQSIFLISATHPNKRGRPVYQKVWAAVHQRGQWALEDGETWLVTHGLGRKFLVNRGRDFDPVPLKTRLPAAIEQVKNQGQADFEAFRQGQKREMQQRLAQMNDLRKKRIHQYELDLTTSEIPQALKEGRLKAELDRVNRTFDSWQEWVTNSMSLEDQGYLQVLAVLTGEGGS